MYNTPEIDLIRKSDEVHEAVFQLSSMMSRDDIKTVTALLEQAGQIIGKAERRTQDRRGK